MADTTTDEQERETEEETLEEPATSTRTAEEPALDLDEAQSYEEQIDQLQATVEKQQEQIENLNDLMVDLSVRVADGRDMGVCPDCNGPVIKNKRWMRTNRIECAQCGRVFHEY